MPQPVGRELVGGWVTHWWRQKPADVSVSRVHSPTDSVGFRGLNVKVARFPQDVPHVLLKEGKQPSHILPAETHQEGQIPADEERQQRFEAPSGREHVQVETFDTPERDRTVTSPV